MLADRGQRATSQRLEIYRYLLETQLHPTAEEIYRALRERFPAMSLATVYKTLELLGDLGLVVAVGPPDGPSRYDGNPEPHINVTCLGCGAIIDLEDEQVAGWKEAVAKRSGYTIVASRHDFLGFCPACRK